jgi:arginine decarboxylase
MSSTLLGNRIPHEYFLTSGRGESDVGSEGLPYETGSYDAALNVAGIQNANVIEYTSVLPKESVEISRAEGLKRIVWGEVLEVIKAQSNGSRNSHLSAAVMITTIHDPAGNYLGGFACEYSGAGSKKDAEESLLHSIEGMIERRGFGKIIGASKLYHDLKTDKKYTIHAGKTFVYDSIHVQKEHGSVFTAICFVSHVYPVLNDKYVIKDVNTKQRKHHRFTKKKKY